MRAGSGSVKSRSSNCDRTCSLPAENQTSTHSRRIDPTSRYGVPFVPECAGRGRPRANTHRSYSVRTRLTDRLEGVLKIIRLVEKTGGLRGADVSTLPAIEEAAAPPAIAQITDEGATGPRGFVHPHTAYPSASSVTILPEQRREHAQARGRQLSEKDSGLVAESWMGLVVPSNRAQVLVRRLDRTAARLLQGHDSLSSGELPGQRPAVRRRQRRDPFLPYRSDCGLRAAAGCFVRLGGARSVDRAVRCRFGNRGKNRQAEDRLADCDIMSGKINVGLEEVLI
jgi:hypothetical protein